MLTSFSAKKNFFTGTLLLTGAGVLSRIIGFFYKIFLSRIIGAEGFGIYQLVFPIMGLGVSVSCAGIETSISRFASKNPSHAKSYLVAGFWICVPISLLLSILLWHYAPFFASAFLKEERCEPLIKILSFCYVPCSIHACINGYYYGQKKVLIPSLSQLMEQFVRVGSVYLFYLIAQEKGYPITVSLAIFGLVAGEIAGMLFSLNTIGFAPCFAPSKQCISSLLRMSAPIAASKLILQLFTSIENLLIPSRLKLFGYNSAEALSIYGILTGMALSVILFPTVLTGSVSALLLPTISEAQGKNNRKLIRHVIFLTIHSCLLLGFACTAGLLITGNFIGNVIFQNTLAGKFILTLSWICPFLYLSNTLNSVFQGLGKPSIPLILHLLACGVRILFIWFFIPILGIKGYLIGLLASQIIVCIVALFFLFKSMR